MAVEIVEKKFVELNNPTIIEGFPSVGLVGAIATEYVANKMEMDEIGFIKSADFPPITLVKEGVPMAPIRIYAKNDIVVIVSDTALPPHMAEEVAREIVLWAKKHSAKKIISLGGIAHQQENEDDLKVYSVSSSKEKLDELKKIGAEPIQLGFLTGVFGLLLMECFENDVESYGFLADAHMEYPDAGAAVKVLEVLGKDLGLEIDTKPLLETSDKIEEKMGTLMEQTRRLASGKDDIAAGIYR